MTLARLVFPLLAARGSCTAQPIHRALCSPNHHGHIAEIPTGFNTNQHGILCSTKPLFPYLLCRYSACACIQPVPPQVSFPLRSSDQCSPWPWPAATLLHRYCIVVVVSHDQCLQLKNNAATIIDLWLFCHCACVQLPNSACVVDNSSRILTRLHPCTTTTVDRAQRASDW
jgi:hypothetical protein